MHDLVVVGAGPAGSMAARTAAKRGLKVLILERSTLPRSKPCSGLIWPETAEFLEKEVAAVPPKLYLTDSLDGICIHKKDEREIVPRKCLNVWRKDFDYWLTEQAKEAGAEVWQQTFLLSFEEDEYGVTASVRRGGQIETLKARFLIGADGCGSAVRRTLYPQVARMPVNSRPYLTYFDGSIDLDWRYFHIWFDTSMAAFYASVLNKGDVTLVASGAGPGEKLEKYTRFKNFLMEKHGLQGSVRSVEGCAIYGFSAEEGPFLGHGNTVLVGDATGLRREYGEGIFCSLGSGRAAGISAAEALAGNTSLIEVYRENVQEVVEEANSSLSQWKREVDVIHGKAS